MRARARQRRVLIVVQNLPVPLDRRVWLECQALTAAGYRVSVVSPKGPGDAAYQELEGVEIYRYAPPSPAQGIAGFVYEFVYCWLRTALLTAKVMRKGKIDVFQACNPPDTYFLLGALLKLTGTRFVFDQHDLCPEVYQARFAKPSKVLLAGLRLLERLTYRTADHVISTNDSYRRIAVSRGRLRPRSVSVVRSGPDIGRLQRRPARPELKAEREFLCCWLGVMGPQDGVDVAIDAASVIVNEMGRTDVHFAFLGFGDCFEELRRQAHELELDEYTTFTGRVDYDAICDYLSTADVGLSPDPKNAFNDASTMNKVGEYMTFGLPVVAFDLHETRVSATGAAVYVEDAHSVAYAKAVVALLDDSSKRAAMGREGRRRVVDALAWQHQAARYVAVYDGLFPHVGSASSTGTDVEGAAISSPERHGHT
jgi:glycosyltransferase involved in cell wall biosynthesis